MVMTLRRHNPLHLGPAIVWYLWLMISTNRFVIVWLAEYERREHGKSRDLFSFHFVLGSDQRSVSDVSDLHLSLQTHTHTEVFPHWMDLNSEWSFLTWPLFISGCVKIKTGAHRSVASLVCFKSEVMWCKNVQIPNKVWDISFTCFIQNDTVPLAVEVVFWEQTIVAEGDRQSSSKSISCKSRNDATPQTQKVQKFLQPQF